MIVNVKSFGAVGDGLNDDTSAIQTAVNEVRSRNSVSGKKDEAEIVIEFPAGTYRVTKTIEI